jgi:hypothetical protein
VRRAYGNSVGKIQQLQAWPSLRGVAAVRSSVPDSTAWRFHRLYPPTHEGRLAKSCSSRRRRQHAPRTHSPRDGGGCRWTRSARTPSPRVVTTEMPRYRSAQAESSQMLAGAALVHSRWTNPENTLRGCGASAARGLARPIPVCTERLASSSCLVHAEDDQQFGISRTLSASRHVRTRAAERAATGSKPRR